MATGDHSIFLTQLKESQLEDSGLRIEISTLLFPKAKRKDKRGGDDNDNEEEDEEVEKPKAKKPRNSKADDKGTANKGNEGKMKKGGKKKAEDSVNIDEDDEDYYHKLQDIDDDGESRFSLWNRFQKDRSNHEDISVPSLSNLRKDDHLSSEQDEDDDGMWEPAWGKARLALQEEKAKRNKSNSTSKSDRKPPEN